MTITHTLADPRVEVALTRMFAQAAHDEATEARLQAQRPGGFGTPQEHADAAAESGCRRPACVRGRARDRHGRRRDHGRKAA
ncbi:hypothetical protein AB0E79_35445, partial [Streptomyces sp. NPDC029004]